MKRLAVLCTLVLLVACTSDEHRVAHLLEFVPQNTFALVKTHSLKTLSTDIKNNDFLTKFSKADAYHFTSREIDFLEQLNPVSEVLLAFSTDKDSNSVVTLITRDHPNLFNLDSVPDKKVETLKTGTVSYQKVTIDERVVYTAVVDSVFVISPFEGNLQELLSKQQQEKRNTDATLEKIYATTSSEGTSVLLNCNAASGHLASLFPKLPPEMRKLANWVSADVTLQPDLLQLSGVALAQDSTQHWLNIFKHTLPRTNELASVTPISAAGFVSYTYDDFEVFQNNLKSYRSESESTTTHDALFKSINEVGVIFLEPNTSLVAIRAIDAQITNENLVPFQETVGDFREVPIKKFLDSAAFYQAFSPLIQQKNLRFSAQLDAFFVFSETQEALETLITDYLNENTLAQQPYYSAHTQHLSSQSSVLFVSNNQQFKKNVPEVAKQNFSKLPLTALQFVIDGHFAHINGIVKESGTVQRTSGVSQQFSIALENELLYPPQFFSNHITKGKDIVVQDVANKLYLISSTGRILWSKQLSGPVLGGAIHEVDVYKNGRIQLAFATKNSVHVIDRNGKAVAPFPLKFNDDITQPLSVFDYDSNRNYRFFVTQNKEVLMYDSKGKTVKGFDFKKTSTPIVLAPKHIRIGNKDYIVIAEQSGKLNILNRRGAHRISVDKNFNFADRPIVVENEKFVVLTADDTKETIDQTGKVTSENKAGASSYHLAASGRTTVSLEDNILKINSHRIELPFGLYTEPVIGLSNRRILVSVTDLQQQRVYVYNSLGELLPNFPVYGTSSVDFGDSNSNGRPNLVVKGEANNVIVYEIN